MYGVHVPWMKNLGDNGPVKVDCHAHLFGSGTILFVHMYEFLILVCMRFSLLNDLVFKISVGNLVVFFGWISSSLVMLDVLVRSHVRAAMAESWVPSQICLQFEGAALRKRSSLSCGNCVTGWEFE
jgi:hypothetical protein